MSSPVYDAIMATAKEHSINEAMSEAQAAETLLLTQWQNANDDYAKRTRLSREASDAWLAIIRLRLYRFAHPDAVRLGDA